MLKATLFASIAFGLFLALLFVIYYVNVDGKWKEYLNALLGLGGSAGAIFYVDKMFNFTKDQQDLRMYSLGSIISSFIVGLFVFLLIFWRLIKSKDKNNIELINLSDIILGLNPKLKSHLDIRMDEIDQKIGYTKLVEKEEELKELEDDISDKLVYLSNYDEQVKNAKEKAHMLLPRRKPIYINNDYMDIMPTHISDLIGCMLSIEKYTQQILDKDPSTINAAIIKTFFINVSNDISLYIFGGNSKDVRVHFRYFDPDRKCYTKLIAVSAGKIYNKAMTDIPLNSNSLIKDSYECRRSLLRSANIKCEFPGRNHIIWKDYLTYTFYDLCLGDIPVFSFGISIKNIGRYQKALQLINFLEFEKYLQTNLDKINQHIKDYYNAQGKQFDIVNLFYNEEGRSA